MVRADQPCQRTARGTHADRAVGVAAIQCAQGRFAALHAGRPVRPVARRGGKQPRSLRRAMFRDRSLDEYGGRRSARADLPVPPARKSEEHTSELQSLMRISYAVLCLQTKTKTP